ncbi:MAG: heavy-metal-associated domain-containing protein [Gemmatimonadetes bacterium]|nr:heavy-metal-associated domain-containing protein [Gemmatimonadota bacterium]
MPTLKLSVPDMRGSGDERLIETTLSTVPGVYGVTASCQQKSVDIDFEDDEVAASELRDRLSDLGFTVLLAG